MDILSSMTSICRRQGIDVQVYLTQLIANLSTFKHDDLDFWRLDARQQSLIPSPL